MAVGKDKKTGKWYSKFRYHDYTGKAIQKRKIGFERKSDALKWEQNFISQHEGQERLTFAQAYEKYLKDCKLRVKKSTLVVKEGYYKHYEPLYGMALSDITPAVIREFQNKHLLKTDENGKTIFTKASIQSYNTQLSAFFSWACQFCGLATNPVKKAGTITIPGIAEKKGVTKDIWKIQDFERFIASIERIDYHLIYSVLFFCGLRRGEVLGLRVKDVDLENGVISIQQNMTVAGLDTPKTKTSVRSVSMPNNIKVEMNEYIRRKYKPAPDDFLFCITPDRITKYFQEKQKKINMVPRIRLNDLRHSHASLLIDLGFDPYVVGDRLGHSNPQMVLRVYGHMYPEKRIEVVNKMNEIISTSTQPGDIEVSPCEN